MWSCILNGGIDMRVIIFYDEDDENILWQGRLSIIPSVGDSFTIDQKAGQIDENVPIITHRRFRIEEGQLVSIDLWAIKEQ
jgi:hypothetical protein